MEYETDVYLQSFYMIKDLTETFGEGIILTIINKTAETQDFEKGFEAATKESLKQFEHDFTKAYEKRKRHWRVRFPTPFFSLMEVLLLLSHLSFNLRHLRLSLRRRK